MNDSTAVAPLAAKRMAMVWAVTVVVVFLVLVFLGLVLRLNQGAAIAIHLATVPESPTGSFLEDAGTVPW